MRIIFLDFDGVLYTYRGDYFRSKNLLMKLLDCFMYKVIYGMPRCAWRERLTDWHHEGHIDLYAVSWLKQLLKDIPDLHIVVSSVWRACGVIHLRKLLGRYGIDPARVISCTPSTKDGYRGRDIMDWLGGSERNPYLPHRRPKGWNDGNPNNSPHTWYKSVEKYCCVDDDSDFYPEQNLFQTDGHDGFDRRTYLKIREFFLGEDAK